MSTTMSPRQFDRIARVARDRWGLHLTTKKQEMVSNRFSGFVRRSRFDSLDALLKHIEGNPTKEELLEFFDILSTNTTKFFRDTSHFAYLEREFLTPLARGTTTTPRRQVRIWSAACSTGCEPYSMAISTTEILGEKHRWDLKILATDLSTGALQAAAAGEYPMNQLEDVSAQRRNKFFSKGSKHDTMAISPSLKDLITFRRLNLMDDWPFAGPFQIIFCCNVMIYFDKETRKRLVDRFHDILSPGGILAVGSAETLSGLGTAFKSVQANVYRK